MKRVDATGSSVKFANMIDFMDPTREGFSNRLNQDKRGLEKILKDKLKSSKTSKISVAATKKIDGVACVIIAFVSKDAALIQNLETREKMMTWDWDNLTFDNTTWHLQALRACLLPHTIWSKRKHDSGTFALNVCLYTATQKVLMLPHYLRAEIENYIISYYNHNGVTDSTVLAFHANLHGKKEHT